MRSLSVIAVGSLAARKFHAERAYASRTFKRNYTRAFSIDRDCAGDAYFAAIETFGAASGAAKESGTRLLNFGSLNRDCGRFRGARFAPRVRDAPFIRFLRSQQFFYANNISYITTISMDVINQTSSKISELSTRTKRLKN